MPGNSFADRNPRTTFFLNTLANGLPDSLDFGPTGGSGNANQNTERERPQDATTQPAQPPLTAPPLNVPNRTLLLVGGGIVLVAVLFMSRR